MRERAELPLVVAIPDRFGTERGADFLTRLRSRSNRGEDVMREVSNNKKNSLRDIILEKGTRKRNSPFESHRETEEWLTRETEKLQKEVDQIIQEAHKKADVIRRRHIMSAEREKATDILRTQNRVFSDALNKLQDKLVQLRDSKSYVDILTGMCVEAIESLKDVDSLTLRLATVDAGYADQIIEKTKR